MINFNLHTSLTWRDIAVRTAYMVVTVALIVWLLPRDQRIAINIESGAPWRYSDLTAMFSFPVYKADSVVAREREQALAEFRPYYTYDDKMADRQIQLLRNDKYFASHPSLLPKVSQQLARLYEQGIIDDTDPFADLSDTAHNLWRVTGPQATLVPLSGVLTPRQAYEILQAVISPGAYSVRSDSTTADSTAHDPVLYGNEDAVINLAEYIVPNLIYDYERSNARRDELISSVPRASGTVQAGQKIIGQGEVIDQAREMVLLSYKREMEERSSQMHSPMTLVGQSLYVLLLVVFFTCYLIFYRSDYLERPRTASMLYTLLVIFTGLCSLLVSHSLLHVFIIPFAIVPIFVRVFMDSRTAFMTHITLMLICATMLYRPLDFIAVETAGAIAAIFTLHELSSRSQLFWTAAITTLATMATNLALNLIRSADVAHSDLIEYYCLLFCAVIIFCSYPLLYVIEKVFGFVSDITLIELSNTNRDLLRRMSEVAPGTFNHSIQVGNLAAEVARKLGANAQLLRTGALYHDIGKTLNPIYFTENQAGGISPHDSLSYIESASIIISHVTEGLKLADKYNLPRQIRDLIATHHGQGKAKYFYVKYKNEHPDEPVDDLLFTYPGPNPFTKEQAILMMADAVEAASRSLPDYTEQTIRDLVGKIVDGMAANGYFRDCPITFRDIQYAKTVLIEKLKTIYHTRISYPEMKK